jgi:hypothetical protein
MLLVDQHRVLPISRDRLGGQVAFEKRRVSATPRGCAGRLGIEPLAEGFSLSQMTGDSQEQACWRRERLKPPSPVREGAGGGGESALSPRYVSPTISTLRVAQNRSDAAAAPVTMQIVHLTRVPRSSHSR